MPPKRKSPPGQGQALANSQADSITAGAETTPTTLLAKMRQDLPPDETDGEGDGKTNQLVMLRALSADHQVFYSEDGKLCVSFTVEKHLETHELESSAYKRRLKSLYVRASGGRQAPSKQALDNLIDLLAVSAEDSEKRTVAIRIANFENVVYIDPCWDNWQVIVITADETDKWCVKDAAAVPVRFVRTAGMLPLPAPKAGGTIAPLFDLLQIESESVRTLVTAFLLVCLRGKGPFFILLVLATQGSGKSFFCGLLRALIDPHIAALRAPSKRDDDLHCQVSTSFMQTRDNVSHIDADESDALCRVATGASFSKRKLYENTAETFTTGARPIIVNGITEVVNRADLLERSIRVNLPSIDPTRRKTETDLKKKFDEIAPYVLGALYDAVSCALRREPDLEIYELPRMADAARWVIAAETTLKWYPGTFLRVFNENARSAMDDLIEGSPFGQFIQELAAAGGGWMGTATSLLNVCDERGKGRQGWPKTGRALRDMMKRQHAAFLQIGVEVLYERKANGSWYTIRRVRDEQS